MTTRTLDALIGDVRDLADLRGLEARYPDDLLTRWLNRALVAYQELVGAQASSPLRRRVTATLAAGASAVPTAWAAVDRILSLSVADDRGYMVELPEIVSQADLSQSEASPAGMPIGWWWDLDSKTVYFYPTNTSSRAVVAVCVPSVTELVDGDDEYRFGVPRGDELVVAEVALKVATRDASADQIQALGPHAAEVRASVVASARRVTPGVVRRTDSRGDRIRRGAADPSWRDASYAARRRQW
jgi:hypothetical protein